MITYYLNEMPPLDMERAELEKYICKLLSNFTGSFDFNTFTGALARYFLQNKIGFALKSNTQYSGNFQQSDKNLLREIIWDLIILRYLTPGGNGHDQWPSLTITSKGAGYFNSLNE